MEIKIKSDYLDTLILIVMYLALAILDFFDYTRIINLVLAPLCLFRIITLGKIDFKQLCLTALLILLFLLSCIFGDSVSKQVLHSNALMLLYSYIYIYIYYVYTLCKNKPNLIKKVLNKGFFIFNITILANFIVLYYQINYPYSIIAKTSGNGIDLYLDLCSGLFTYGGTHVLNIFTCFLVVYNFSYSSKLRNPYRKRLLIIWNLVIIGLSLFISMFNDNKAMFILVPLITIIYFFTSKKSQSARVQRIFCSLLVTLILVPILYNGSLSFKEFIDDNVLNLFDLVDTSISAGNSANGSGERIAMIKYALSNNSTFMFGTGLATTGIYTEDYLGFHHFGQADLGTLLNLGGIYFVTTMVICYFRLIIGIVDKQYRNPLLYFGLFCFFMFVLTYTQACTSKDLCLALILVALAFRFKFQNDYKVSKC